MSSFGVHSLSTRGPSVDAALSSVNLACSSEQLVVHKFLNGLPAIGACRSRVNHLRPAQACDQWVVSLAEWTACERGDPETLQSWYNECMSIEIHITNTNPNRLVVLMCHDLYHILLFSTELQCKDLCLLHGLIFKVKQCLARSVRGWVIVDNIPSFLRA